MNIIQDLILVNRKIVFKSFKSTIKNWKIFLVGVAYGIASLIMWRVAANAWILSGIIMALFQSAIISNYLYLIENIVSYDRFTLDDFKEGFTVYLRKVYMIVILFWFIRYGFSIFLRPVFYITIGPFTIWALIQIIGFFLLNALPETIYQKHYFGFDIITYSIDFIKENIIQWYVPNIIIFLVAYGVNMIINLILRILGNQTFIYILINIIVFQLLLSFAMIYRGHLFNILSTSTRRKRMFMRDMYL